MTGTTRVRKVTSDLMAVACSIFVASPGHAADAPAMVLHYADSDYGRAFDARSGGVDVAAKPAVGQFPLTIQVRIKMVRRNFFFDYVIAAAGRRGASPAWELSVQERDGVVFTIGGSTPQRIATDAYQFDENWHEVTVHADVRRVQIYVDGNRLHTTELAAGFPGDVVERLWIGQSSDGTRGCEALLDDVHIAFGIQPVRNAWEPGAETLLYLNFEESQADDLAQWTPLPSTRADAEDWERESDEHWIDPRFQTMDKGPFFANSTTLSQRETGSKNLAIRLDHRAQVLFDSSRCVTLAGLTDAQIEIRPARFGILRRPQLQGLETFYVDARTAWQQFDANGELAPVAPKSIHYEGLSLFKDEVVLRYRAGNTRLLELSTAERTRSGDIVFRRDFQIARGHVDDDLALCVAETDAGDWMQHSGAWITAQDSEILAVRLERSTKARLVCQDRQVFVVPATDSREFSVFVWRGRYARLADFDAHCAAARPMHDLKALMRGGPRRWGEPLVTQGTLGTSNTQPYVIDDITIPFDNPYRALMFATGLEFFSSGTAAAVCTVHGDVWLVRGIDEDLDTIHWQRFATGLYQPLGLRIIDDLVYVLGRDQITRLHDLNQDGEADDYENFNNDLVITGDSHAYAMCLETDPEGNFYFLKSGKTSPHGGTMLRLSRDGTSLEVFATGYRHPNGLGVGPDGTITAADNQGNWIPSSAIQIVERGSFHGYMPQRHRPEQPDRFDPPLCWIPVTVDNSSGGQVWCESNRWGPFRGDLLHLSWGRCTLHLVMRERVNGQWQGGTTAFPDLKFASGSGRARFNPRDGQLYVCGLDGWQTAAERDGCFQRVRYTGRPVFMPKALYAHRNGIRLEFTSPLNLEAATQLMNYEIRQWQYRWSEAYGSPEYSIADPGRVGYDRAIVTAASVLPDGKTVFLRVPSIRPVMQMQIHCKMKAADGSERPFVINNTIHQLGEHFDPSR